MSIVIRDVREHELDSVLALNNNAGLAILPLDSAKVRRFYETAEYFRVAERDGNLAGFLVGFGSGAAHDSSNFAWFGVRYPRLFYFYRIVVASCRRGGGVGRAFYADGQSYAELRYP
ncbi:MAG: GNAT family N-acetyltransferase, partial [Pseudoxanthomonas sp.]